VTSKQRESLFEELRMDRLNGATGGGGLRVDSRLDMLLGIPSLGVLL
jgi:hypothetical protein